MSTTYFIRESAQTATTFETSGELWDNAGGPLWAECAYPWYARFQFMACRHEKPARVKPLIVWAGIVNIYVHTTYRRISTQLMMAEKASAQKSSKKWNTQRLHMNARSWNILGRYYCIITSRVLHKLNPQRYFFKWKLRAWNCCLPASTDQITKFAILSSNFKIEGGLRYYIKILPLFNFLV